MKRKMTMAAILAQEQGYIVLNPRERDDARRLAQAIHTQAAPCFTTPCPGVPEHEGDEGCCYAEDLGQTVDRAEQLLLRMEEIGPEPVDKLPESARVEVD